MSDRLQFHHLQTNPQHIFEISIITTRPFAMSGDWTCNKNRVKYSLFRRHTKAFEPLLITRSVSPKNGVDAARDKGNIFRPQSLPFVSPWFVLMWEPNPAKADYICIKFLKIAIFLRPHLPWKCNSSSLQIVNPELCFYFNKKKQQYEVCSPPRKKDVIT